MSKHTPTPWKNAGGYIYAGDGDEILVCIQSTINEKLVADAEANAAFVVKAVNRHDELVEALESLAGKHTATACDSKLIMNARAVIAKARA